MIGLKLGLLTVIDYFREKGRIYLNCKCDCGNKKIVEKSNFRKKHQISCGCNKGKRHWIKYDVKHPLYIIWISMKMRCYNPNEKAYKDYGARGVTICQEWLSDFQDFFDWAIANGWEKGKFIDKDIKNPNSKEYSPENCSIVTRVENNRARRGVKLTIKDADFISTSLLSVKELAKTYNVHISSIYKIKRNETWKNLKTS